MNRQVSPPPRRAFSLLLVIFVLTLMGVALLTLSGHFTQTARYAQMTRLEARAAQILHSGLAWAKIHHADLEAAQAPFSLDAQTIAGTAGEASLLWTRNIDATGWKLAVTVSHGRHRLTRTAIFHSPSPESNPSDSR